MIICSCQNIIMMISALGLYWQGMAQMMNSHKLLIGEPGGKSTFYCGDNIKTATEGIGYENVVWINVDQKWSPVACFFEQFLAQA